ncbi:MAG: phosphoglycerate mutase family protein, partial [Spirochaetota bacterium]
MKTTLKNRYLLMRHGQSRSNAESKIISLPSAGIHGYGLTDEGRQQVLQSIDSRGEIARVDIIYTSDFLRAR